MDFIIDNLPILICAVVGIVLLVVEMFMPGFGIPGIAGILLLLGSIVLTWRQHGAMAGLGTAVIVLAAAGIVVSVSLKSAAHGRLSRSSLILKDAATRDEGYLATEELNMFIGRQGRTLTVLRPGGTAEFDGVRLNVVSQGEYIPQNVGVIIEKVDGPTVLVRRVEG